MSNVDKDKLVQALSLPRKPLLPGFDTGRFEQPPEYDRVELRSHSVEETGRRDNRINIRISGRDLTELQKQALAEGIPTQSLIANIVHQYVTGTLVDAGREGSRSNNSSAGQQPADPGATGSHTFKP